MIYKKILDIAKKDIALKKDWQNPHFKSTYLTLDSIIEVYSPLLAEIWVIIYHQVKEKVLYTYLYDTEDETSIKSEFEILNSDPQKRWAEITYWKRYNLGMLLNIMTEIDDDWNKSSWENFSQRDLLTIINEMKTSLELQEVVILKDEAKELAKSEKQKEWLKKEYEKKYNELK